MVLCQFFLLQEGFWVYNLVVVLWGQASLTVLLMCSALISIAFSVGTIAEEMLIIYLFFKFDFHLESWGFATLVKKTKERCQ